MIDKQLSKHCYITDETMDKSMVLITNITPELLQYFHNLTQFSQFSQSHTIHAFSSFTLFGI